MSTGFLIGVGTGIFATLAVLIVLMAIRFWSDVESYSPFGDPDNDRPA